MEYRNISNKDSGKSVREKLNTMLSSLIDSSEGVNTLWSRLLGLVNEIAQVASNSLSRYNDLRKGITQSYDYIDRNVAEAKESFLNSTLRNKGYFSSYQNLVDTIPISENGCIAYIGTSYPYRIYKWNGEWVDTGEVGGDESVRMTDYYTKEQIDSSKVGAVDTGINVAD